MTAESYISHFSHLSSPLLVEFLPICVDDFQYIFDTGERRRRRGGSNARTHVHWMRSKGKLKAV